VTFTEERFRHRLLDVDKEQTRLRLRVSELESQLKMSETEALKAQRRLKEVEKAYIMLQKTASIFENDRHQLEKEVCCSLHLPRVRLALVSVLFCPHNSSHTSVYANRLHSPLCFAFVFYAS